MKFRCMALWRLNILFLLIFVIGCSRKEQIVAQNGRKDVITLGELREDFLKRKSTKNLGPDDLPELKKSLVDRFGPIPPHVQSLLSIMELKILGQKIGLAYITLTADSFLSISFYHKEEELAHLIKKIISQSDRQFEVVCSTPVILKTAITSKSPLNKILEIKDIFENQIIKVT